MAIQRALLSVSDKSGLIDFAKGLAKHGVELLSTGGTAQALREAGLDVMDVSEFTGAPELFEGHSLYGRSDVICLPSFHQILLL